MGVRSVFLITLAVRTHNSPVHGAEQHWQKMLPMPLYQGALLTPKSVHDLPVHMDKMQFVANGKLKSKSESKVVRTTDLPCMQRSQDWV